MSRKLQFLGFLSAGNFRSLRLENVLFNPRRDHTPQAASSWSGGKIERHEVEPFKKNQFLRDLEDEEREIMARNHLFCICMIVVRSISSH